MPITASASANMPMSGARLDGVTRNGPTAASGTSDASDGVGAAVTTTATALAVRPGTLPATSF